MMANGLGDVLHEGKTTTNAEGNVVLDYLPAPRAFESSSPPMWAPRSK
jgi:hypothetical protein